MDADNDAAARAAALAERILDEVSGMTQDWGKIAAWARELAAVAEAAAGGHEGARPRG